MVKGWMGWFVSPLTPPGWTHIVNEAPTEVPGGQQPGIVGPTGQPPTDQARRPSSGSAGQSR
jgi:hypothetical protein